MLAPITAHYSWSKGLKLLGLGRAQLELLPERGMRLDADALQDTLGALPARTPAGADGGRGAGHHRIRHGRPGRRVVAAREAMRPRGLGFAVHVDGAWGGYLATLFRNPDGSLRDSR